MNLSSNTLEYAFYGDGIVSGFEDWTQWPPNEIKVKRLTETATLPTRGHPTDAGLDLYADEDVWIHFGQVVKIKTGIAMEIPEGFYGDLRSRSSFWSLGMLVSGTIDSAYRGEIIVVMGRPCHLVDKEGWTPIDAKSLIQIKRGDKIAQLVLTQIITPAVVEVTELSETQRGCNGFGSTGG